MANTLCVRCDEEYRDTYAFCPYCGQDNENQKPPRIERALDKISKNKKNTVIAVALSVILVLGIIAYPVYWLVSTIGGSQDSYTQTCIVKCVGIIYAQEKIFFLEKYVPENELTNMFKPIQSDLDKVENEFDEGELFFIPDDRTLRKLFALVKLANQDLVFAGEESNDEELRMHYLSDAKAEIDAAWNLIGDYWSNHKPVIDPLKVKQII